MATRDFILASIRAFCIETGLTERQLGDRAVRNPKIVSRIRRGGHVTTETIERLEKVMADERASQRRPVAA